MTRANIEWCAEQIKRWTNEDPSMGWAEIWEALCDCLDGERVTVWDRVQIRERLAASDVY